MTTPLRAAVVGFGRMAAGYAEDPAMARHYPYATHAQVLSKHPAFDFAAVVDPDASARELAHSRWSVAAAPNAPELGELAREIDVVVLATPPEMRLQALEGFPNARAVLVEKPLGSSLRNSLRFLDECRARDLLVQVNLWRRADERFRALADGELATLIGVPQAASGVYGNGLLNNGIHMVDFVRMLLGEIAAVHVIGRSVCSAGPIPGDTNPAFALQLARDVIVTFQALDFSAYRENGLDMWGSAGRLAIQNEGLSILHYRCEPNRAMSGQREIACDEPARLRSTVGFALYNIYTNLAEATAGMGSLWSSGESALRSTVAVEAIRESEHTGTAVSIRDMGATAASAFEHDVRS